MKYAYESLKLANRLNNKYAQTQPINEEQKKVKLAVAALYGTHLLITGGHPGAKLTLTTKELESIMERLRTSSLNSEELSKIQQQITTDIELISNEIDPTHAETIY
jgi:hypothetical protein